MKSSSKSLPVKLVNKGDFLIPVSSNEKTDSMLNCDMTRIQKTILNKYITNPLKNKNESRFKHLFHKNQTEEEEIEEESLKNVIFNLNYGRNKEKLKTVSPSLYLSPDLDLSNTNLIRYYSSKENKSILEFNDIPEDEDLFNNQLSIIKEEVYGKGSLISLANEDNTQIGNNNGINQNLHENEKVNRIRTESKDMNERIFKRSNSSDDDENNEEVSIKDYKKYLSQEVFFNKKSNTSAIPSKTNENSLVSKDNFPTINLDSYMIKGGSKPGSNFNTGNLLSLQSNECSTMTFSISIEQIITLMLNPVLQKEFLYEVQNNYMRIISLIQLIKSELEVILSYEESVLFLYNVYIIYKNTKENEKGDRNLFFDIIDIYQYACMSEGLVLLKLLFSILTSKDSKNEKIAGIFDIEYVYSSFNSINQWNNLIFNKYGKNYIEFFLKSNLFQSTHTSNQSNPSNSYNLLFSFLNNSFISFSKMNYSTFVIQIYVEHHHEVESFEIIKNNVLELSSCRNGIFVLLAGVKGYKSNQLTDLLLTILSKLDTLCNDIYASTLMEYIFKTHTNLSANYLINHKLNCLFSIIENQYGNFIIQKLISIIEEGETKRKLVNEIKKIIPYLKRQNIKKKWLNIVINAESLELKGGDLNDKVKPVLNKKGMMKNESSQNDNEYMNSKSSKNYKNTKENSIYSSMENVQTRFSNLNMNVKENISSK